MKMVGVVGGSVGTEPFSPATWSGSSRFLFNTLQARGVLERAFGIQVPQPARLFYMLKNWSSSRRVWRQQFYLDKAYRAALTSEIGDQSDAIKRGDAFLQIGAMFNMREALGPQARCFSYHDGTLAEFLRSQHVPAGLSKKRIDQGLAYEREVYHSMNKVLAMSEYHRQSFITDFGVSPDRAVNVGCAINLEKVPEYNPAKKYDSQELLFVGVDFVRKGGALLLEAFQAVRSRFPKATLHIVGPKALENPGPGVVMHGFLRKGDPAEKRQLDELFTKCCLFVLPSFYEGVGVSSLEAMVFQMPAVVTDGWGFRDAVIPGVNGDLVQCGSRDDLAAKLERYLGDPDKLREMGEAGRKRVLEEFTWDKVGDRIIQAVSE